MKPDCPNCQSGRCKTHKTSPFRKWMRTYGPARWYWEIRAIIAGLDR